jgi:hypothetical protein
LADHAPAGFVREADFFKHRPSARAGLRGVLPDQPWVQTLIMRDMNISRRVLAQMSPLSEDDISFIEATFRKWTKQLKAVEGRLS